MYVLDTSLLVLTVAIRGVASLSIRFLAVAAECLAAKEAQEEVFRIIDDITKETGWRSEQVKEGLQQAWGWNPAQQHQPVPADPNALPLLSDHTFDIDPTSTLLKMPPGVVNPIMALSLIHISEPTRRYCVSRMPSSA